MNFREMRIGRWMMEMVGARVLSNPRPIVLFPFSLSPFQDEDERYIILFECSSRKRAILLPDPTSLSLFSKTPALCTYIHTSRRTFFRPTSLFYATFRFSLLCVFHPTLPHQWMKILKMAVAGRRRRNSPSFPAAPSEFSTWPHTNI